MADVYDTDGRWSVEWTPEELAVLIKARDASEAIVGDIGALATSSAHPGTCDTPADFFHKMMENMDILIALHDDLVELQAQLPRSELIS